MLRDQPPNEGFPNNLSRAPLRHPDGGGGGPCSGMHCSDNFQDTKHNATNVRRGESRVLGSNIDNMILLVQRTHPLGNQRLSDRPCTEHIQKQPKAPHIPIHSIRLSMK